MADPKTPDPHRTDPAYHDDPNSASRSAYSDPAADPRIANQTVIQPSSGRGGLIAAAVIAVLLVIALIAFSTGPATDPGTTAVIPDPNATEEAVPPAAEETTPPAAEETVPPAAQPADPAPTADQ
jgi:hypothetical protein